MSKYGKYLALSVIYVIFLKTTNAALQGFKNGQAYTITSAASGKVITSGSTLNYTKSSPAFVMSWNDEPGQKWYAIEAPSLVQSKESSSQRFYLVPYRQEYNLTQVTRNGTLTLSVKNLPPQTEVLSLDSVSGNLTTEVFSRGASSQQWIPEDGGENSILLRNLGNNQCIKNYEYLYNNLYYFLQSIDPNSQPNQLSTLDCATDDLSQKWLAEL